MRMWHDVLLEFSSTLSAKQKIEMLFFYDYHLTVRNSKNCRAEET